jgi:hypothetical protein
MALEVLHLDGVTTDVDASEERDESSHIVVVSEKSFKYKVQVGAKPPNAQVQRAGATALSNG